MDYYESLEIPRTATQEEVAAAYRHLVFRYHPDRRPENPEEAVKKFKEITEAFRTLSDLALRHGYDVHHPAPKLPPKKDEKPIDPNFGKWWSPPPPKYDLWGQPLEKAKASWKDAFANSYESESSPDIR